jgi:hypothetical protein
MQQYNQVLRGESQMLSSKCLFSLIFFLLKISSICHVAGLARLPGVEGGASAQSYPQLL